MEFGKDLHRSRSLLAERVRRGMTGEIAADLQTLITKAKPILEKADVMSGVQDGRSVDLMDVLGKFLQERVMILAS
ncbi:hypothetical protein JOM56_009140 [Amanita muscaria]